MKVDRHMVVMWSVLRDRGNEYTEIARRFNTTPNRVTKWIRNYQIYGDSLFTDYPTRIER